MRQEKQNNIRLDQLEKTNVFSVPEDYFVLLPDKIVKRTVALGQSILQVPTDYFETLPERILQKMDNRGALSSPALKDSIFQTPANYFEELKVQITQKTEGELQHPLAVPEDYFDDLSDRIQQKIKKKEKVIKVDFRQEVTVRYLVAASVLLLLCLSTLFYFLRPSTIEISQSQNEEISRVLIASLDKKEIAHYLEKQDIETHDLLEFATRETHQKIQNEWVQEMLPKELDKHIDAGWDDLDMAELPSDI